MAVPAPTVTCISAYYSTAKDAFAFEMFAPAVGQYFTVYALQPDAYTPTTRYALTFTPLHPGTDTEETLHTGQEP